MSGGWEDYRSCWLFALSLYWQLDILQANLPDNVASAAFAIVGLLQDGPQPVEESSGGGGGGGEEEVSFPWDEAVNHLPKDLAALWKRAAAGQRLDLKAVLSSVPRYAEVPAKPPVNNLHAHRNYDKTLKVLQQQLLHLCRLAAFINDAIAPEKRVLYLQLFNLLAELNTRVEGLRREASVPGSTRDAQEEELFDKSDVQKYSEKEKVQKLGMANRSMDRQLGGYGPFRSSFRVSTEFTGWRQPPAGKGWGAGKGKGWNWQGAGKGKGDKGGKKGGFKGSSKAELNITSVLQSQVTENASPGQGGQQGQHPRRQSGSMLRARSAGAEAKVRRGRAASIDNQRRSASCSQVRASSWKPSLSSLSGRSIGPASDSSFSESQGKVELVERCRGKSVCSFFDQEWSGTQVGRTTSLLCKASEIGRRNSTGHCHFAVAC